MGESFSRRLGVFGRRGIRRLAFSGIGLASDEQQRQNHHDYPQETKRLLNPSATGKSIM